MAVHREVEAKIVSRGDRNRKLGMQTYMYTKRGCTLYRQDGPGIRAEATAVDTVDTVGAGDAFGAAFLWSFYQGLTLEKCVENGNIPGGFLDNFYAGLLTISGLSNTVAALLLPMETVGRAGVCDGAYPLQRVYDLSETDPG